MPDGENFDFILGDEEEDEDNDEDEEEEADTTIGEVAIRDMVWLLASREVNRAKYTGPPKEGTYREPSTITGTRVTYHQTFGRLTSKAEKEKQNRQSEDEDGTSERKDTISRAVAIAHAEITSGRKVKIRDQKDDMDEYKVARASLVDDVYLNRNQGWARRESHLLEEDDGMYGASYMTKEYKAIIVELFDRGVEQSCNKMSPSLMREELELRFPGFYTYPPESEITSTVCALFEAQKKAKNGITTTIKEKKIPANVEEKLRTLMAKHPVEKGAAIADIMAAAFPRKRIPGCTRKEVMDRVNSLRGAERAKARKTEMRQLIG
jgi:hypothetical protein